MDRKIPWCNPTSRRTYRKHSWSLCTFAGDYFLTSTWESFFTLNILVLCFARCHVIKSCDFRKFIDFFDKVFPLIKYHHACHHGHPRYSNFCHHLLEKRSVNHTNAYETYPCFKLLMLITAHIWPSCHSFSLILNQTSQHSCLRYIVWHTS